MLAAYKAELVVGLAADRPASGGPAARAGGGGVGGVGGDELLDEDVSEFFADELALILNCSRTAATQQWEHVDDAAQAAAGDLGGAGRRLAGLAAGAGDRRRAGLAGPGDPGRRAGRGWRRWCCRRPPGCRSPGCGRWSAGS